MRPLCALSIMIGLLTGCDTAVQPGAEERAPARRALRETRNIALPPSEVVRAILLAAREGDERKFWSYFSRGIRTQKDAAEAAIGRKGRMFQVLTEIWTEQSTLAIGAETISGKKATVEISGDRLTTAFLLRREDGAWVYVGEQKRTGARRTQNDLEQQIKQLVASLTPTVNQRQDRK